MLFGPAAYCTDGTRKAHATADLHTQGGDDRRGDIPSGGISALKSTSVFCFNSQSSLLPTKHAGAPFILSTWCFHQINGWKITPHSLKIYFSW